MCVLVAICDVSLTYDLSVSSVHGLSCDLFSAELCRSPRCSCDMKYMLSLCVCVCVFK